MSDYGSIGTGIVHLFYGLFVVALIGIFAAVGFAIWFFVHTPTVRSYKRIKPRIELVVNNNKIDTVFIYEQPSEDTTHAPN